MVSSSSAACRSVLTGRGLFAKRCSKKMKAVASRQNWIDNKDKEKGGIVNEFSRRFFVGRRERGQPV